MEEVLSADLSILSIFVTNFSNIFRNIETFSQIQSRYQALSQLDHLNRNYREIYPPMVIPICKKPGLFRVNNFAE